MIVQLQEIYNILYRTLVPKELFSQYSYIELAKQCHPDHYVDESDKTLAEKAFKLLQELNRLKDAPFQPCGKYTLVRKWCGGDVSDIYIATKSDKTYIIKLSKGKHTNRFLINEETILKHLLVKSKGLLYDGLLPGFCESILTETGLRANIYLWREDFLPLSAVLEQYPSGLNGRHIAWIFKRLLMILGFVHANGVLHNAIFIPHTLIDPEDHAINLIDWVSATKDDQTISVIPKEFKSEYPPEVLNKKACPASDIYLASKLMLKISTPTLPVLIKQFLLSCSTQSVKSRPDNAWELHDQFNDVLVRVYGKPQFTPLVLT